MPPPAPHWFFGIVCIGWPRALQNTGGTISYIARWENWHATPGMQRATLGKNGFEAAPQLQGWIARAFSSNSLVNTMEMAAAIQYI